VTETPKTVLALLALLLATGPGPGGAGADPGKVGVIYCTDLFHPHDDPDDHFDLAALYAIEAIDIKGIVLDQGRKQDERPGSIPVEQMNRLTGRTVPWAKGLSRRLKSPDDPGTDQPDAYQKGVKLILESLARSEEPVTIITVGSLRDVAAAFNRKPELFRKRVAKLLVFIGAADPEVREYNVDLDRNAYVRIMNSGLPVWWVPCFDGGLFKNRGNASYWRARHAELLRDASDRVMRYFVYALGKKTDADPLGFLDRPVAETDRAEVLSGTRNLWCAAVFTHVAGLRIGRQGKEWTLLRPGPAAKEATVVEAFRFRPVSLHVDAEARVVYGESPLSHEVHRFQVVDRKRYPSIMTSVTRSLIGMLGRVRRPGEDLDPDGKR